MRHLGRFRASASGLLSFAVVAFGLAGSIKAGDAPAASDTVQILDATKAGELAVTVRGAGDDHVKFTIQNKSARRLNVVIPPGLVAASSAGQGFQSMGLGVPTSNPGGFGAFRSGRDGQGFRSIPAVAPSLDGIGVSPGQTIELPVPSVCLNFGLPTPTAKNVFELVDVETFTPDVRVRKALKSLATLGTSQGVAQATMWNVCNGMSFGQIGAQSVKPINSHELAQAARFVEALDLASSDLVDANYFQQGRILLRVGGTGPFAKDARRLVGELEGTRMMGLPIQVVESLDGVNARPGTIFLSAAIVASKPGHTTLKVSVRSTTATGEWRSLGQFDVASDSAVSDLKADALASDVGRAMARTYVSVVPVRRTPGTTTVRVTNRLPMTIANVTLKAGKAGDPVTLQGLGIGPVRSATAPIPAATAVVDSVELNGL
ncbi:MAG: hypothetical protein JWN86_1036 [Planctomycetota bacterium]|nr:hypothetical protein [Planctomycetota bacterium]